MRRASGIVVAIALACAACAASSQEIQTARSARYTCGFERIYDAAGKAIEEVFFRVGASSAEAGIIQSEGRWYEETGSPRKRGDAIVDSKDVLVVAEAHIIRDGAAHRVSIAADVIENLVESPQGRRLGPDDPNRPTWVQGKLDRIAVSIHERLQGCAQVSAR
jgi:hypothetical protein